MKFMLDRARAKRGPLVLGLFLALIASLANLFLLSLSGWLIASAGVAGIGGIVAQNAFNMTLPATGVRFFAILRIVARYGEKLGNHDVALRAIGAMRSWSFRRLVPHSTTLARQGRSGDFLNRFVNDTDKMGQVLLEVLVPIFTAIGGSIVAVSLVSFFEPASGALLAVGLALGGLVLPAATERLVTNPATRALRQSEVLQEEIVETIHALDDLLICGDPARRLAQLDATQKRLDIAGGTEFKCANAMRQAVGVIAISCATAVVFAAASAYGEGRLSGPQIAMLGLGALAAFEFIAPLMDARLHLIRYRRSKARVMEICAPPPTDRETGEKAAPAGRPAPLLQASKVGFATPSGRQLFSNVDLTMEPGDRIAITGASGAGKTSLGRIIAGLSRPTSGRVAIADETPDGLSDTHKDVGMLAQDFHLFSGSVKDNLLLAKPRASESELWRALELAGVKDEIKSMPQGIDTPIGERGAKLSGGQARRLAAAQILLQEPKLLVLDEPTESLPPDKGRELMRALTENLPHSAILCITHRKEPLPFMNRVYNLDKGRLES